MGYRERATVVRFPVVVQSGRSQQAVAGRPGAVVRLWGGRDADTQRNRAWDDLLTLVDRAWSWRDPESLEALEGCLTKLGVVVEADWGNPSPGAT